MKINKIANNLSIKYGAGMREEPLEINIETKPKEVKDMLKNLPSEPLGKKDVKIFKLFDNFVETIEIYRDIRSKGKQAPEKLKERIASYGRAIYELILEK